MSKPIKCGAVVLCGGESRRMGRAKATLPFGGEAMLQRVVRLLGEATDPIVVVAAREQALPPLPAEVGIARDERPAQGPLEGLRVGLAALAGRCDAAYATSCDVPLLVPAFVSTMIDLLGDHDIAVPIEDEFHHPLAAVYRVGIVPQIERLLAADQRRPVFLYQNLRTRRIPVADLKQADPSLRTLSNLNQPADYLAALAAAGLPIPPDFPNA